MKIIKKKVIKKPKREKKKDNFDEKKFYEKYIGKVTCAYEKDIKVDNDGKERCYAKRTQEKEKYLFKGITPDVVLIECPNPILAIEYEKEIKIKEEVKTVDSKQIKEWIKQTCENAKDHEIDFCIVDHGGTSPYFYACNFKNLIENREKECKKEITKLIVPKEALEFLDLSNLGNTLIPIINRPHWKKKRYNGAIHKIVKGKNPDEHKNKVPDVVLQRIFDNERPNFPKTQKYGDSDINSISLSSVISTAGLKKRGQEYQGSNPWHGSGTGMNFVFNPSKNVWHCFRCGAGGSVAKAIALNKRIIISCDEDLSATQFKQVLEIAREEYGLKKKPGEYKEKVEKDVGKEVRGEIRLPKTGKLISDYAKEVSDVLSKEKILFFRTDSRDIVEIGKIKEKIKEKKERIYTGFIPVKPSRFITLVEKFFIPGVMVKIEKKDFFDFEFKPKSMTADLSNTILQSHILEDALPNIDRIFTASIPIIYNDELTFPRRGYDERFKSWLPYNSPKIINSEMTLEEAKSILYEILKEFCFQSDKDYTIAIAGLITPFLRGLYSKFNSRTPVFFYLGNRERVGKDYLAGINGIIYEGVTLQEPPICKPKNTGNSDDELRKKLLSAFLSGRKRLHFANNKGYLNNAVFEAIITAETYSDRLLGKNEAPIFDNELEFSLSGNIGIGYTPDLAYRSRFIRLFLDIEDSNARKFERPNLHKWVLENRELILSAIYCFVKKWFEKGCPSGKVAFASFPEWARVCGGIMETAGYDSPCEPDKESLAFGGDSETTNMKGLFEICYEKMPDKVLTKKEIRDLIEGEDIFAYFDFEKRSDQVKFGTKITKFIGRVLSDIRMKVVDSSIRSSRQQYIFTKEVGETDKSKIFGDIHDKSGNLGNQGNLLLLGKLKPNQSVEVIGKTLPRLPRLPKTQQNNGGNDQNHQIDEIDFEKSGIKEALEGKENE